MTTEWLNAIPLIKILADLTVRIFESVSQRRIQRLQIAHAAEVDRAFYAGMILAALCVVLSVLIAREST